MRPNHLFDCLKGLSLGLSLGSRLGCVAQSCVIVLFFAVQGV